VSVHRKVAAVVTTFNSGETIRPNLARIAEQVDVVIIVDDSGDAFKGQTVDYAEIDNAILLRNDENLGVAAALNRGVAKAGLMGCDWVITLDDDTLVSSSYMLDVFDFVQADVHASAGLIACSRVGTGPSSTPDGNGFRVKRTLITSGCVFEIKTFREVGGFDESMFIDLVDFDFCTKLRKSGQAIVLLNKQGMDHRVGNSRTVRLLSKEIVIYNHSPFRLYYQMRNVFLFARKHLTFDPLLTLYLLLDIFRLPMKALLFEQQKRARFFYLAMGLIDGVSRRGGRLARKFREPY
jgi:rhamnosyltransferase